MVGMIACALLHTAAATAVAQNTLYDVSGTSGCSNPRTSGNSGLADVSFAHLANPDWIPSFVYSCPAGHRWMSHPEYYSRLVRARHHARLDSSETHLYDPACASWDAAASPTKHFRFSDSARTGSFLRAGFASPLTTEASWYNIDVNGFAAPDFRTADFAGIVCELFSCASDSDCHRGGTCNTVVESCDCPNNLDPETRCAKCMDGYVYNGVGCVAAPAWINTKDASAEPQPYISTKVTSRTRTIIFLPFPSLPSHLSLPSPHASTMDRRRAEAFGRAACPTWAIFGTPVRSHKRKCRPRKLSATLVSVCP